MRVSEYIAEFLGYNGVTDVFGIPGGVILDLMYAFDAQEGITPHLSYHEQCAGFAACGYAQLKNTVGVAYATKGPGFTNLLTAIADAYYDSIPVLFIIAHTAASLPDGCRLVADQDMDTCAMVRNITKYAKRIDNVEDIVVSLQNAYEIALEGRKGPVFLDFAAGLFRKEVSNSDISLASPSNKNVDVYIGEICMELRNAKRPVILVGDGINQSHTAAYFNIFANHVEIPVLSSRYSHNIVNNTNLYYGYVGSHGIRYANFILSKSDLVVSLGNRLYFPSASDSYGRIVKQAKFFRFDVDDGELEKHPLMHKGYNVDMRDLFIALQNTNVDCGNHTDWIDRCNIIRNKLWDADINEAVINISKLISTIPSDYTIVNDVGNNEFWVSRACVYAKATNRTLYSKSFGALGNALGKAIGAYYASLTPVIVFVGDQGLQMNIQELQFISQHSLPIAVVLLNNHSSGMIKDREMMSGYDYSLHTTLNSGYGEPCYSHVAKAYGIEYFDTIDGISLDGISKPLFVELNIYDSLSLTPSLPKGRDCQDMEPRIDESLYNKLNSL